jgi:hypothetical protein
MEAIMKDSLSISYLLFAATLLSPFGAMAHAQELQAYCARVGDDDRVQPVPDGLVAAARRLFELSSELPDSYVQAATSARCAGGKVMLCNSGANLICEKADTRRIMAEADEFCRSNPNSIGIPMSVTGHATVYDWSCAGRRAQAGRQTTQVDANGFIAENWKPLE